MLNVFGHINPDSDAICTAVVAAHWLNASDREACAWRLGEANRETCFIFSEAGIPLPPLSPARAEGTEVWLVDFTEPAQGPEWLPHCNVTGIIDHHRLGGLATRLPPEVCIKPVGSSATVLWLLMSEQDRNSLPPALAILLLGAILSDTVNLRSPTTTESDIRIVTQLCVRTGVSRKSFACRLLTAKTDTTGLSPQSLIDRDLKAFVIAGTDVRIAQVEVMNRSQLRALTEPLLASLSWLARQTGAGLAVLMLTNITDNYSTLYFAGPAMNKAGPCSIPGMLSRKKQLLPWLETQLNECRSQ